MEKQVALNPNRSIKGGIYARYSPGRDRDQTSTIELRWQCAVKKPEAETQIRSHSDPFPKLRH